MTERRERGEEAEERERKGNVSKKNAKDLGCFLLRLEYFNAFWGSTDERDLYFARLEVGIWGEVFEFFFLGDG